MHTLWPGHCHCQLGQRKGGVGQSLSSLISLQSLSPSHVQPRNTQFPLSQRKNVEGQVRGGQAWCSSLPSSQSGWPSHSHVDGRHVPSDWHWNSLSWWHIPGGRVAERENQKEILMIQKDLKIKHPHAPVRKVLFQYLRQALSSERSVQSNTPSHR